MHRDEKIQLFINREAIERDSSGAPSSRASNWARTFQSNPETPLQIGHKTTPLLYGGLTACTRHDTYTYDAHAEFSLSCS